MSSGRSRKRDPLIFAVSLVSTKIPFPETSKEYIAEVDEIRKELRLCLQQAGRKLMRFQHALKKRQAQAKRLKIFEKYAPVVSSIVGQILGKMDEEEFPFMFSSTQFTNCLTQREGSIFLPKNPIPVEALPMDSIEGVNLERYDIQTLQDLILLDESRMQELISLGMSEEATDQAQQILSAILELPELAKEELVESASVKALTEFAKQRGIVDGLDLFNGGDSVSSLPGIGPATEKSLKAIGVKTVKDFFVMNNEDLSNSGLGIGIITDLKSKCSVDVLPNITSKTIDDLHNKKIFSVIDFLQTEQTKLAKVFALSSERITALTELIKKSVDLDMADLRETDLSDEVNLEELSEEEQEIAQPKKVIIPNAPLGFLNLDDDVGKMQGIGKAMADKLKEKGIETVGKFYMASNSRLLKIKGLGEKTIALNRANTDITILPRITFEGKRDLNLMGIFTVQEFFDAEDDSLTNVRGLRSPTITKIKLSIEERLLKTPGSARITKPSTTTSTKKTTKPKPLERIKVTTKTPTKKKEKEVLTKDQSIAEFLGAKKTKQKEQNAVDKEIKEEIGAPPKGWIDPSLRISKLEGFGKTTEDKLAAIGIKNAGDVFKKDLSKIAAVRGIKEEDIIELRKNLSVEVLPHITTSVMKELNVIGIFTVKQFHNAKIAKTSSVKGLGVKTVKVIRNHIIRALKTSAELQGESNIKESKGE